MRQWYPRDLLRRTNWLHRVDALRIHDIREMRLLWEATSMIQDYCHMFVIWENVIMLVINSSTNGVGNHLHKVLETIMSILQMLLENVVAKVYYCLVDDLSEDLWMVDQLEW